MLLASAEPCASHVADAPAVAAAHVSPFDSQPAQPSGWRQSKLSSLLGSLSARPDATPTLRSARPTSPICARTACAAAWRSAASAARSPLLARPVVPLCEGV